MKRIGILTSGGDAPGMNAAIRAVVRSAEKAGAVCLGIRNGYRGLLDGDVIPLTGESVSGVIQRGGTLLYTARCPEFKTRQAQLQGAENAKTLGLDALVVLGGDGSFRGAEKLSGLGIPTVGIPCTIDNDISCTSYSIGFDTASNVAVSAVDRLRDTSESHHRCSVVEVMGHRTGFLALDVAAASGAAAVLIPERETDIETDLIRPISEHRGNHSIVIAAEGSRLRAAEAAGMISRETGVETRLTVLGHVQRGGAPTAMDRIFALRMGHRAVRILMEGEGNRVVAVRDNRVVDMPIDSALSMEKRLDPELMDAVSAVSCKERRVN